MHIEGLSIALVPGLDGSGRLFQELTTSLAPRKPACLIRYPLHEKWDVSDYVNHLDQSLPTDENLLLIAESFSGPLALELLRSRSNIKALVLVASFARCPNPILHLLPFIPLSTLKPLLRSSVALRAFCLGNEATPDQIKRLKSVIDELPSEILRCRLNLLRTLRIEAKSIPDTIPILHLIASKDRLVCRSSAPDLSHAHADSRVVTVNGPHFLLQSCARDCATLIQDWIARMGKNPD